MIKTYKNMRSMAGAIVLSGGVPELMFAWRLSQAVIMATHISHEINASRLKLSASVRFGNPTDNDLNVSYPIIKYFYNHKLLFISSDTDQTFNLRKGDEICFDPISVPIFRQSYPDPFNEYSIKEKINIATQIRTLINEKIPCIKTMTIRI